MEKPFLLAQVSDMHIKAAGKLSYRIVDTAGMLRACIRNLMSLKQKPDAVAFTGDLVDFGRPDEYAVLRELLSELDMPVYLVPGNHDDRAAMRAAFPDHGIRSTGIRCASSASTPSWPGSQAASPAKHALPGSMPRLPRTPTRRPQS